MYRNTSQPSYKILP